MDLNQQQIELQIKIKIMKNLETLTIKEKKTGNNTQFQPSTTL